MAPAPREHPYPESLQRKRPGLQSGP